MGNICVFFYTNTNTNTNTNTKLDNTNTKLDNTNNILIKSEIYNDEYLPSYNEVNSYYSSTNLMSSLLGGMLIEDILDKD